MKHVNTWSQSSDVVRLGDHPSLGLCLDSFHVLSRTPKPEAIAAIADRPGEKIFFLQLADAPMTRMDVLLWSRHHRLFPGQADFNLPLNDIVHHSAPVHSAVDALRSLLVLGESVARSSPANGEKFGLTREVVQRVGAYAGYGSANSAVRMTAQRSARPHRSRRAIPAV